MTLSADEIVELSKRYTLFDWSAQAKIAPMAIDRAEGVYFYGVDGSRYLDFNSQLMGVNIGHGDKRVIDAIAKQGETLPYITPFAAYETRALLGQKLATLWPGEMEKSFFTLGGAEANENAIKIARVATGREWIVAFQNSFHGRTYTAMTASLMPPEVMDAIEYASKHYVMLDELHDRVGQRIATLVRAEAAMVTSGAASALTLGTAGILTGTDRQKIVDLPNLAGMKSEVIIQKAHRFGYDHAVRNCGVRLVEVETREELEQAIGPQTAMMLFYNNNNSVGQIRDEEFVQPLAIRRVELDVE